MRAGRNETLSFDEERRQKVVPQPPSKPSDACRRLGVGRLILGMKSRTAVNEVSSCHCHRASRYPLSISLPRNLIPRLFLCSFLLSLSSSPADHGHSAFFYRSLKDHAQRINSAVAIKNIYIFFFLIDIVSSNWSTRVARITILT